MDNLENNENMNENIDETNENINEEAIDEAYEKEIEAEKLVEFDGESEGMELSKVEQEYGADEIQVLEGLEAVRKRPGMYIGSTGPRGLHHLVYEIVDNSIDEALAGYCTKIDVVIEKGDIIRVTDNGRGIPVGVNSKTGLPAVTVVFTVLHAGGKFGGGGYKVSGGLHGVGASVVNALSEWLEVKVCDGEDVYFQRYERGKIVTDLQKSASLMLRVRKYALKPTLKFLKKLRFTITAFWKEDFVNRHFSMQVFTLSFVTSVTLKILFRITLSMRAVSRALLSIFTKSVLLKLFIPM